MFVDSRTSVREGLGGELRPSFDADVWPSVLRAFEAAIHGPSSEAMIALHAAAREFAATERGQGLPPERAVIALKALLAGHGERGWSPSLDADRDGVRIEARVYAELFSWFVAALYDNKAQAGGDD